LGCLHDVIVAAIVGALIVGATGRMSVYTRANCRRDYRRNYRRNRWRDRLLQRLFCVNTLQKLIHTATPETTKLSCLCRVGFGSVNWILDNARLSPTEKLKSEHVQTSRPIPTGTPERFASDSAFADHVRVYKLYLLAYLLTHTGPSCRIWCGGVN